MRLGNAQYLGTGIDGRDGRHVGQSGSGFCKNTTAAANVEQMQVFRGRVRGEAGAEEGVADRVHEMEYARGPMGVPPRRGEGIEVGDFGGIDGRGCRVPAAGMDEGW